MLLPLLVYEAFVAQDRCWNSPIVVVLYVGVEQVMAYMGNTPCASVDDRRDNTGREWSDHTLKHLLSLHVPPSEGVTVRSTDLPYGHLPIRSSVSGVYLVPLRTQPTRGTEAVVHQLLVALAPVIELLHECNRSSLGESQGCGSFPY